MYLKNTDETYIKLEPVGESPRLNEAFFQDIAEQTREQHQRMQQQQQHQQRQQQQQQENHHLPSSVSITEEKLFLANNSDALFGGVQDDLSQHNMTTHQPATRPDRMVEQLTDELVRLTLHQDTAKHKDDNIMPWRNYGDFVRWSPEPHLPSYYTASVDMPSRQVQEHLINVFFSHCHHLLPTISRSMFFDQLNVKGPLITPLLLNVMYAHAAKHVDDPSFRSHPDNPATQGNLFYNRARRLVDDFLDVPRVSTVIALLYMASYDYDMPHPEGRSSRAWMYSGMAIRMCIELGLHTANYSSQMSQFDIELRKRVLWTCYVMDKLESCMMERPWMLKAKDIALDFPTTLPEDDNQERVVLEGFSQLCRLMILAEQIIHFFAYDTKNRNVWTMNEESQTLRFIEEIRQWREKLPDDLRWTPSSSDPQYLPGMTSSSVVINLHLVGYDLELSLLMCCRYQDEQLHRAKRRTLANTITHLVSLTVEHQRLMYTFALSAFSGIFAALVHASDFEQPNPQIAEEAKAQFRRSLKDIRAMVERIPIRDMRNFARLVDLTLQPQMNGSLPMGAVATTAPSSLASSAYANAFSAITDLCNKNDNVIQRVMNPTPVDLFGNQQDIACTSAVLDTTKAFVLPTSSAFSPMSSATASHHSPYASSIIQTPLTFDPSTCIPSQSSAPVSSSSGSSSPGTAAAKAAAAAAIGAVGAPTAGPQKSIEPADYTFELISVADEWARSFMYQ